MKQFAHLPRLAAAVLFAASASTAVVVAEATHAGNASAGPLTSAAQPADAAVSVGVGIGFGAPHRYYRYAYRGGTWVRFGYGYAAAPGFVNGFYVGYGPPAGYYAGGYYGPAYGRPYYRYPSYARGYYGHAYYGHGYYGHGYYGRGWR